VTEEPWVVAETEGFLVVCKPPLMHSAPLRGGDSVLGWCAERYPDVLTPQGLLPREGGLLHRLDYETWGLVLIARTQEALAALQEQQRQGSFVKEYDVLAESAPQPLLPGFPPQGPSADPPTAFPCVIESGFRPYGPGNKAVRPVLSAGGPQKSRRVALDQGRPYQTGLLERRGAGNALYFQARIRRGFRHQIRCHLSWLGHPVLGDGLYGGGSAGQPLMLQARRLSFLDPFSGETRRYQLPSIIGAL
jgi:23S rRNA pseudouridine1911/1915/1917 synthase